MTTSGSAARVALVTSRALPDLWDDDHPLRDALLARGVDVATPIWDDPDVDWTAYDLAVLRSPWDYPARRDAFVAWAATVPRLANPADVVEWNTDKRYLSVLAGSGVPVTPTTFVAPGDEWTAPRSGEWVIKPSVGAGSKDAGRYALPHDSALAEAHVRRLGAAGRTVLVQPYLTAVDTAGETAVLFLPDASGALGYSHGIRKGAMLTGPDAGDPDPSAYEQIEARVPTAAERAVAEATLDAVPGGRNRLLYARVDLIPGPDGAPLLVELELTEPSLFFRHARGSADRLAAAILTRI